VTGEHVELMKGALVEQILNTLTGKHLVTFMLPGN
jgi:hypothetical protein